MTVGLWIAFWGGIITWTMVGEVFRWVGGSLMVIGLVIAGLSENRILRRIEKLEEKHGK